MSRMNLEGKVIVVAGAAGRIGSVVVDAVLESGASVVAFDSDENGLMALQERYLKRPFLCCPVDISDRSSIQEGWKLIGNRFGNVDGAVNTAYPRNERYGRSFFDVECLDFRENVGLHLGAYFSFMQFCARYSLEQMRPFSLVNLSSIYGSMAPRFDIYNGTSMTMPVEYAAIKAGLEHMTRYVNAYVKGTQSNFRANCVSPGGIIGGQDRQFVAKYREHCLTKGMLDASDVAGAIVFLLSDAAQFVVGQNLIIDDGFSV